MTRLLVATLVCLAAAPAALAQKMSVTCPIGGERFTYEAAPPLSSRETYLDQRPVDPNGAWPLAKCPGNGFVIYSENFPKGRLGRLREIVQTDQYQQLAKTHTTRYLEAVLRKSLGESPYVVAWSLLQASWQAADQPELYKQYAGEALATYDSIPLETLPEIRQRILKRMVSAELARRLGQFDSARERLLAMRDSAELSKPFFQRIVELQLKLVREKNTGQHKIPY